MTCEGCALVGEGYGNKESNFNFFTVSQYTILIAIEHCAPDDYPWFSLEILIRS